MVGFWAFARVFSILKDKVLVKLYHWVQSGWFEDFVTYLNDIGTFNFT